MAMNKGIKRYHAGHRPWKEVKPNWFLETEDGLLPLKYIYALSKGIKPRDLHTKDAKKVAKKEGYRIVKICAKSPSPQHFQKAVAVSLKEKKARAKRLAKASPTPRKTYALQEVFLRNPDVVAEVLERADGICEACHSPAPFLKAKDGNPYLEVHHKKTLAEGGEDTVANAIALCPNCHRQRHFGMNRRK